MADPLISNQRDPSQLYGQTGTAVIDFGPFPAEVTRALRSQGKVGSRA